MKAMIAKVNHFHATIISPFRMAQPQIYRHFQQIQKNFQKNLQFPVDTHTTV
jgi:hypothetical protein